MRDSTTLRSNDIMTFFFDSFLIVYMVFFFINFFFPPYNSGKRKCGVPFVIYGLVCHTF